MPILRTLRAIMLSKLVHLWLGIIGESAKKLILIGSQHILSLDRI
jgi:hypothetical protein